MTDDQLKHRLNEFSEKLNELGRKLHELEIKFAEQSGQNFSERIASIQSELNELRQSLNRSLGNKNRGEPDAFSQLRDIYSRARELSDWKSEVENERRRWKWQFIGLVCAAFLAFASSLPNILTSLFGN